MLGSLTNIFADDTDIIDNEIPQDSNVLFVMDMSGSMSYELTSDNTAVPPVQSRLNVLQDALSLVITDPTLTGINVGVTSFAGDTSSVASFQLAHGISYPVSEIDDDAATRMDLNPLFDHKVSTYDGETITSYLPVATPRTSRGYIGTAIPSTVWTPSGGTPIVDALYEAALYFRGGPVAWGKFDPSNIRSAHPSSYTGLAYNKTEPSPTPVYVRCGATGYPACNGTQPIPCPQVPSTDVCNASDATCINDHITSGYVCAAPVTNTGSTSCDFATCSATTGCDISSPVVSNVDHTCNGVASGAACEASNSALDAGSCSADNHPSTTVPGTCLHYNDANICDSYGPDVVVPAYTDYNCTTTSYSCPTSSSTVSCTKDIEYCTHATYPDITHLVETGPMTYNSPITTECSNNAIILLSDGKPSLNWSAANVETLIGPGYGSCDTSTDPGRCGVELAKFLASEDHASAVTGNQNVKVHTIGLALSDPSAEAYLQDLASNGEGLFVNATSPASLAAALKGAILSVSKARSFSSPTYATTGSASMSHGDFVYLPVFDRGNGSVWIGNLKKYKHQGGKLKDADGNNATDSLGGLKDEARDYWSATVSTQAVQSGGVANKIDPVKRKNGATPVYTDNGASGTAANLRVLNNSLSNALFEKTPGTVSNTYKDKLVNFILGEKSDGSARHHMGDIIHSKPVYVSYGGRKVLFVGTNEGYLHAIDEGTGEELYAFMPSELLKTIDTQYRNDAVDKHVYGVDGPITLWHDDTDKNGVVDSGETAILYFGLRRGGKSYYALDVSNRTSPSLKWRIKDTGQFSRLGFTWSQPVISHMKYSSNSLKPVLVFGGGYIDDNGSFGPAETDGSATNGTEVYIVDAMTGSKVWKLSDSSGLPANATKYSKPAKIRVIDLNRNGSLDRLYYSDTGGNIWRVDFNSTNLSTAKVMHFASLGGSPATGRKFFTEPDVALFRKGGHYIASIAIGSGERPKPLDASRDDHFFVLFDNKIVSTPSPAPSAITMSDLLNATGGPVNVFAANKKGWYMDLVELNGEKVLSTALTYQNMVFFSSFGTTSITPGVCSPSNVNQARLYALDLLSGAPSLDFDGDSTKDKSKISTTGEIPDATQIIFNPPTKTGGGGCTQGDCGRKKEVALGKGEAVTLPPVNELQRVYWIDENQ